MRNKIVITCLSLLIVLSVQAQSKIDSVLAEVARNNKTIQAHAYYNSAKKLQLKTGLAPANPTAEYDYLIGSPSNAGNQHDFTFTQTFDFPTTYVKKSQLAKEQSAQLEFGLTATKQDILLEAKRLCVALVYHNKLNILLTQQKQDIEKLLADFTTKMDKGEGNILDVNKAKLRLIEIKKVFQENISTIAQLNEQLTSLNGGKNIAFKDTTYFTLPIIPDFEKLETEYEYADPLRKSLEQEKIIAQKQLEVSKALWLPKFEVGYHYQGILGQKFNGIHTGLSLPLWENKNTVKANQSKLLLTDVELQEHRNEHYYEIKTLYEKYRNLAITVDEYRSVFSAFSNNTTLLDKALRLGEISIIEYFMEMNYYSQSLNNYLLAEKEYYDVVTELFKYQL